MPIEMMAVAVAGTLMLAAPQAPGQPKIAPNAPEYVKSVKAPGLAIRYLDFNWDEQAFHDMENGGPHPAAQRSWVLARLQLQLESARWSTGKRIPVGASLLVLNPRRGSVGSTLEIRYVDMREVFTDMNVIAEPPPGETYHKAPAVFTKVEAVAPRLEVGVEAKGKTWDITVHYGDRQTTITLTR
jgi:hypothetical protein